MVITILDDDTHQTIDNFGASDCWTIQKVGLWNDVVRNDAARKLFSQEFDRAGNPLGIGLSLWRVNIGAGSAAQGDDSNIADGYRRAECFLQKDGTYDFEKQAGQIWFAQQARKYGVEYLLGFVNSPPVYFTKSGKANSHESESFNLREDKIDDYGVFIAEVIQGLKNEKGVMLNYVSPIIEPQWQWRGGQEGMHANNKQSAKIFRAVDQAINRYDLSAKQVIPEAGSLIYLYNNEESGVGTQIDAFWGVGESSIADLTSVAPVVSAHNYFLNWPLNTMLDVRRMLRNALKNYPELRWWQTEYCIMGMREGVNSVPRDTTINLALYVARLLHLDLTVGSASAWHWWLGVSHYDYNDGLIVSDILSETIDESKLLWAFGNFSRFIRPGAVRLATAEREVRPIEVQSEGVLISAYKHPVDKTYTAVAINMSEKPVDVRIAIKGAKVKTMKRYETSASNSLTYLGHYTVNSSITLAPRSICTFYGLSE